MCASPFACSLVFPYMFFFSLFHVFFLVLFSLFHVFFPFTLNFSLFLLFHVYISFICFTFYLFLFYLPLISLFQFDFYIFFVPLHICTYVLITYDFFRGVQTLFLEDKKSFLIPLKKGDQNKIHMCSKQQIDL